MRIFLHVITHFADKNTQAIFKGEAVKRVPLELQQNVLRKLQTLDAATCIADLQAIPGLHCKVYITPLWSIRVNSQYRITFTFTESPMDVRNVMYSDYH